MILVTILLLILLLIILYNCRKDNFDNIKVESEPEPPFPIDVVISWAGPNDSVTGVSDQRSRDVSDQRLRDVRLRDNGEMKVCLKNIVKFMPWVRNIFITGYSASGPHPPRYS